MGFDAADAIRQPQHTPQAGSTHEILISGGSPPAPDPFVPADLDLRALQYMPLFGAHLFGSTFNALATDSEWRAGMTLWWAAWTQVPAGSLPADDASLTRLADFGRDVKRFRKLKTRALHGFVLCSDGRLYHPYLCEQALVALDRRIKERVKKARWRELKRKEQAPPNDICPDDVHVDNDGTSEGGDGSVPSNGTVRDGTVRENKKHSSNNAHAHTSLDPSVVADAERACALMQKAGCRTVNASHQNLIDAIKEGITPETLEATAIEAVKKQGIENPFAWSIQTARSRRNNGSGSASPQQPAPVRNFFKRNPRQTEEQKNESLAKGLGAIFASLGIGGGSK